MILIQSPTNIMDYSQIILNKKNITDFAEERNRALSAVERGKWVLFLDSDETLSPELKDEIRNLNPGACGGFYVKRKNYFLGRYAGTDKIIRLVKKGSGKWARQVHETYHPRGGIEVGLLKNYLIHNTAKNLHAYIDKINNYSTLHALANKKEGKKASVVKIIFYPIFKFVQTFVKSGHVVFSLFQSFHSFLSWSKLYFLRS